jgi:hypothetical protein
VTLRLWTVSPDLKAGQRTAFRARQQIDLAKAGRESRTVVAEQILTAGN